MDFPIFTPDPSDLSPSLKFAIEESCRRTIRQERPFLLHTIAIPGAGKSTFIDTIAARISERSPITLGFDRIMRSIPEYQAEPDRVKAFKEHELPAREAGYLLLKYLLDLKANILFDHTASDPRHVDLLKFAKTLGYGIVMVRVIADPERAKARILERQQSEGRHTPPGYVDERLGIIEQLLGPYNALSDSFHTIVNRHEPTTAVRNSFFQDSAVDVSRSINRLRPMPKQAQGAPKPMLVA